MKSQAHGSSTRASRRCGGRNSPTSRRVCPEHRRDISDATNNAWFFPQIIKLAASKGLKDFTATGIAAWASAQTDFTTGFLAPINWKDAGPLKDYPRFTTLYAMPVGFKLGDPYLIKSQFQSLSYDTLKTLPLG